MQNDREANRRIRKR
ncbi:BnaA09g27590D [Brassica napus]|uniref:BnaA09g27590D protein n=1 Tax=Brassica napus TaxID=3708 RepID=A0A078GSR7_BRANA|nr:BnaA09g27590D [Brassica napus]